MVRKALRRRRRHQAARAVHGGVGDGVVGVNGSVSVCVISTSGANSRIASAICRSSSPPIAAVVAEVQAPERGAEAARRRLGLGVADALDVLGRLALLLPQLARLAALAVGERDHLGAAAAGDGLATAPPARQTKSAECAPMTCTRLGIGRLRARTGVLDGHVANLLVGGSVSVQVLELGARRIRHVRGDAELAQQRGHVAHP